MAAMPYERRYNITGRGRSKNERPLPVIFESEVYAEANTGHMDMFLVLPILSCSLFILKPD